MFQPPPSVQLYPARSRWSCCRDPIRLTLALLGSVILMLVMGYGINMDVEDLTFAVLDRDQTTTSRDYILNLSGSRYFSERPPINDYAELDQRMRSGEISLAIEIPPGFARDLQTRHTGCHRRLDRRRHAARALKRCAAMCRGCMPTGWQPWRDRPSAPQQQRELQPSRPVFAIIRMSRVCRPWCRR